MTRTLRLGAAWSVVVLLTCLLGARPAAADAPCPRLAIVPLPGQREVPETLVDLVAARLAASREVVLLERTEIATVLREQALGSALGGAEARALAALLRADALLILAVADGPTNDLPLRFRLLDSRSGMKLADATVPLAPDGEAQDLAASVIAGRSRRGLASWGEEEGAVPIGVLGFASENVARRFDWVGGVLAAGIEEHLVGRAGVVVLERERLGTVIDENTLTGSLSPDLRASAVLVEGAVRVEDGSPEAAVVLSLVGRRGGEVLGTETLRAALSAIGDLAARAADAAARMAKAPGRSLPMTQEAEVELLLDEVRASRRLRDHARALRLLEGAHALSPDRLDLQLLLLEVGGEAFRARVMERGPRTTAWYAQTVPSAFRRIALAERIVANSLPHDLHAHLRRFGWGNPERSYYVPGILELFSLPRLHRGPAGAGPEVRASLALDLGRLLARYRDLVRGKNDHLMASLLASATKAFPDLVAPEEDSVDFAIAVRAEAAGLMQRIALPEGPTGLRCGEQLLQGPRGDAMRFRLLEHEDPLVRLTGLMDSAQREPDADRRRALARKGIAMLADDLIDRLPASSRHPWYGRFVTFLAALLPEAEKAPILAALLDRPATPPPSAPPSSPRLLLALATTFGTDFYGGRLVDEEGVLAVMGTAGRNADRRLVLHRLDPSSLDVLSTREIRLPAAVPRGSLRAAVQADGTVWIGHATFGVASFPASGVAPRLWRLANSGPVVAVGCASGRVHVLIGGPHGASGLVTLQPESGASTLVLSSRAKAPSSLLDGRPLRAMCGLPKDAGLLLEAGPRTAPRPEDPAEVRARSTFYRYDARTGEAVRWFLRPKLDFLGEGSFVSIRRWKTRALVQAIPFILDVDLDTGHPTVLYAIPVTRAVGLVPTRWRGPAWVTPLAQVGVDLIGRKDRREIIFVDGEPKPGPLWPRVRRADGSARRPTLRDLVAWGGGALVLTSRRIYLLTRVE